MKTALQDEPMSANDSNPPEVWPREPDQPEREPACPAPDDEQGQMLEEPGYGHGV